KKNSSVCLPLCHIGQQLNFFRVSVGHRRGGTIVTRAAASAYELDQGERSNALRRPAPKFGTVVGRASVALAPARNVELAQRLEQFQEKWKHFSVEIATKQEVRAFLQFHEKLKRANEGEQEQAS